MITGTKIAAEINEAAAMKTVSATDEIKRNHLQATPIKPLISNYRATEFSVKFNRLKKALRKRSSSIF